MANINIGGRLHSVATGNTVAGANEIYDDDKQKKQSQINEEVDASIEELREGLADAGKVDDVKVNGVSVRDEITKEANINITASVVENDTPGTPAANTTMQGGNINIEFEHIKGKRGNGIASVTEEMSEQDGEINTHTITDDDGHTHTIHTRNGQTGGQGIQGLQGNSGYQGAAGELQIVNNLTDGGQTAGLSAEMGKALSANIGYGECSTAAATKAKTVSIAGYILTVGGCLRIKMANKTTVASTLNVNSVGAKELYYNGKATSGANTWKEGEVLTVFYDGTRYQAYNIQGGSSDSKYFLNVNQITDDVYTLATAIPVALAYMQGNNIPRSRGFIITYKTAVNGTASEWEIAIWNYAGSQNDSTFGSNKNWKIIPDFSSVISEVRYKGAILNLNLFNDTVYTLTTAIATAFDLMGAKRGLIIMFKVDSAGNFAYYRYTYAYTLNETNFKNEAYWVDWGHELKTKTPSELVEEQGSYKDITSLATYEDGKKLDGEHNEASSGLNGIRLYTCPVKSRRKYKLARACSAQMTTYAAEYFCFYDAEGNAILPLEGSNYTFLDSAGYKINELTAPVGATTLKVVTHNAAATPFAIFEQTGYNFENSIPKETNSESMSEVAKILDITGKIATPIEVKNGYKIAIDNYKIVEDTRVKLYIFSNGFYHAQVIGHSQSVAVAAYDGEWNPVEVLCGGGYHYNIDVYPVQGAKYIVFAGAVDTDGRILQAAFLPKYTVPFHEDNPIPLKTSGLKILVLGNSFSQNTFIYIRSLINQANIQDCTIASGRFAGATIEDWHTRITTQATDAVYEVYSNEVFPAQYSDYSLNMLLAAENWDIIILQQRSAAADSFGSFFPYMTELMSYIKEKVRNRRLCFMFNMVWASEGTFDNANKQHYNNIVNTTKRMCAEVGISHVIPTGVGIQYGRHTNIETPMNWTSDALHLDNGVGRYLAAATAFQYIFSYINGVDVRDYNAFRYESGDGTPVTADNIDILNQCAADAVNNRFMLEEITE